MWWDAGHLSGQYARDILRLLWLAYANNEACSLVIVPAAKGENVNYNAGMAERSGKCYIQIACGTSKTSGNTTIGQKLYDKAAVAVESGNCRNFFLWLDDQTVKRADDAFS